MEIQGLWRYPVKSMGGEQVDACEVCSGGVVGDRAYALVDRSDGKVASAKHPRKWSGLLEFAAAYVDDPSGPAMITFPDGPQLRTDDPTIDQQLSAAVGRDVTLTTIPPEAPTYEADWPDIDGVVPDEFLSATRTGAGSDGGTLTDLGARQGTFLDLGSVHLLASATLAHLATLAPGSNFDARRYRPNVVVDGAESGFAENGWMEGEIRLGDGVVLRPIVPTMRCVMTTLAQGDLPRDTGTLRAVAAHNRVEIPGLGTWSCVGIYADVVTPGTVRVGDDVTIG